MRFGGAETSGSSKQIYTYCGRICIAVNPYEQQPHFFTNEVAQQYHMSTRFEDNAPHIFAVAEVRCWLPAGGVPVRCPPKIHTLLCICILTS